MSLAEKLQEIRDGAKEQIPEETRALMHQATAELQNSGIMDRVLRAGSNIPPFELPNSGGTMVSSSELLKKGPLVMTFYRGVW